MWIRLIHWRSSYCKAEILLELGYHLSICMSECSFLLNYDARVALWSHVQSAQPEHFECGRKSPDGMISSLRCSKKTDRRLESIPFCYQSSVHSLSYWQWILQPSLDIMTKNPHTGQIVKRQTFCYKYSAQQVHISLADVMLLWLWSRQ